jgi:hypothetical protein
MAMLANTKERCLQSIRARPLYLLRSTALAGDFTPSYVTNLSSIDQTELSN